MALSRSQKKLGTCARRCKGRKLSKFRSCVRHCMKSKRAGRAARKRRRRRR
jgi:hypothetical protein